MSTQQIVPVDDAANIVSICGWCPQLHILKLKRRYTDVVIVVIHKGKPRHYEIFRNGEKLQISHGICPPCKEKLQK